MQAVRSAGSKIERTLGSALCSRGFRYRKNDKSVFGRPDFTFKRLKIAIFVDSEFWHGKDWEAHKLDHRTNQEFWHAKIEKNIARDLLVNETLRKEGWTVLRFWGAQVEENMKECVMEVENATSISTSGIKSVR